MIGSDPADEGSALAVLAGALPDAFIVESATRLSDGLERLQGGGVAAVLLDGPEPDSQEGAGLERIWAAAPHVPVLVIGEPADEGASTHAGGPRGA